MSHYHATVWMDHREARVFQFSAEDVEKTVIHPDKPHQHLHHKAGSVGSGHAGADKEYLDHIMQALDGAQEILVVGPGKAKLEFIKHCQKASHKLSERIVGVETVDHPSDGQVVAYARQYFKAKDKMLPR